MKYYIIVTEGFTDCATVESILEKFLGYTLYFKYNDLPNIFQRMVGKYPNEIGELQKKDSPSFYYKNNINLAVKQANGCSKIAKTVSNLLEILSISEILQDFKGFIIITDTDTKNKSELISYFRKEFANNNISLNGETITYENNEVQCYMNFIPQEGQGAIEKLLLDCSKINFSSLFDLTNTFREQLLAEGYSDIRKKYWATNDEVQSFYADKVQFGFISSVLKPDRPMRYTIKDEIISSKFEKELLEIPEYYNLYNFIKSKLT
ncbi:hypothetical protein EHE19_005555 [Ruminiclostridium herbifermentans]|uniref:DUF4276 family protein n=1 Tax=Ruminiclostridium herbifermentans TaxID=2488810 RepID=A0A4U7JB30_9FIRM|nr:DUF3226 domain-containing protein [Ruminiclostridium herbifermentans]QNU67913.1 hypothetical protein EHE19_005555 [Ruminiclostridium herbifermentans]